MKHMNIFKKTFVVMLVVFLLLSPMAGHATTGKHTGEVNSIEYEIVYLDPQGITTVHEEGINFIPFDPRQSPTYSNDILPARYLGEYPLYFVGNILSFEVHITNTGSRKFKNLHVIATHELLNTDGEAGEAFDGGEFEWFVEEIGSGETSVLLGSMVIPVGSPNGIDQTHLKILHGKGNEDLLDMPHNGRVIVDDTQAGLWCPV